METQQTKKIKRAEPTGHNSSARAQTVSLPKPAYFNIGRSRDRLSFGNELRCIEWKTGKVKWSKPGLLRSSLLYVNGCFVVLSENGTLRLIRATAEKYDLLSEVELRRPASEDGEPGAKLLQYPAWAAPILSHGLLYVRGRDRVVCLDVREEG